MKKTLFVILLILFAKIIFSQNTTSKFSFKVSNQFLKEKSTFTYQVDSLSSKNYTYTDFTYFHPTFAIQFNDKKNNVHELELIDFYLNNNKGFQEIREFNTGNTLAKYYGATKVKLNFSFKYEYIVIPKKFKEKKLKPSLGFGLSPYLKSENQISFSSNNYPTSETKFGLRTFITPRISYFFTERFFLDINIPLAITNASINSINYENPNVPINQRRVSVFDFNTFPKFWSARIGLGLRV